MLQKRQRSRQPLRSRWIQHRHSVPTLPPVNLWLRQPRPLSRQQQPECSMTLNSSHPQFCCQCRALTRRRRNLRRLWTCQQIGRRRQWGRPRSWTPRAQERILFLCSNILEQTREQIRALWQKRRPRRHQLRLRRGRCRQRRPGPGQKHRSHLIRGKDRLAKMDLGSHLLSRRQVRRFRGRHPRGHLPSRCRR